MNLNKGQTGFEKYPELYGSPAWRYLRLKVKDRDVWLCQSCLRAGKEKMVGFRDPVHHKKPHNGNRDLFFDIDNLESICQSCHDSSMKIFEKSGYIPGCDINGLPIDPNHFWRKP